MRRTRGRVVDVDTLEDFDRRLGEGARSLSGWRMRTLDLTGRSSALRAVEVAGSLLTVLLLVLLGAFTFAGMGLLAASRARTVEGVSGINNIIMLPMFVLSGVFFSASRFPEAMQPLIQLLPLTALNDALRAVYNEGAALTTLPVEVTVLFAWTLGSFALALRLFRWQ